MSFLRKNLFQIGIGLSAGLFFLALFLRNVDLDEIGARLAETKIRFVALSALATMIAFYFRALRWRYFLMPIKRCRMVNLFSATAIGYMISTYTPRLGEIVRPCLLGAREKISKSAALATIVVERVFDLLSVLFMFSIYLVFYAEKNLISSLEIGGRTLTLAAIQKGGILVAALAICAIAFLLLLRFRREPALRLAGRLLTIAPARFRTKLLDFLASFADGLALFQSPRNMIMAVVMSAVTWLFVLMAIWIMPFAFGFAPLPFTSIFFVAFTIVIGVSAPIPGAVGSFHFMCALGYRMVGLDDVAAVTSLAIMLHLGSVIPINLVGIIAFWREGISLYFIGGIQEEPEAPDRKPGAMAPVIAETVEE